MLVDWFPCFFRIFPLPTTLFRKPTYAPERVCRSLEKPLVGPFACPSHFSCPSDTILQAQHPPARPGHRLEHRSKKRARDTGVSVLHSRKKLCRSSFTAYHTPSSAYPIINSFRGSHLSNCSCLLLSTCPLSISEAESGPFLYRPHTRAPQSLASLEDRPSKDLIIIARRIFFPITT
jgi:hypothetical protein